MHKIIRPVLGLVIWLGCSGVVRADILLEENFDYGPGRLVDVSNNAWVVHFGETPLMVDENGAAFLNQPDSVSGREDVHREMSVSINPLTDNITKLYAGFTVNFTSLPTGSGTRGLIGSFFAHFRPSDASEAYARVGATLEGAAPGEFRLAVSNESWNSATTFEHPTPLHLNVSYRVLIGLDLATDRVTLWVDPEDENSTSVTATDLISYGDGPIASFALRQGYTGGTTDFGAFGALRFDDLVIATQFSQALVIPEPALWVLFSLGFAAIGGSRKLGRR